MHVVILAGDETSESNKKNEKRKIAAQRRTMLVPFDNTKHIKLYKSSEREKIDVKHIKKLKSSPRHILAVKQDSNQRCS